jgi:hypothetical protein
MTKSLPPLACCAIRHSEDRRGLTRKQLASALQYQTPRSGDSERGHNWPAIHPEISAFAQKTLPRLAATVPETRDEYKQLQAATSGGIPSGQSSVSRGMAWRGMVRGPGRGMGLRTRGIARDRTAMLYCTLSVPDGATDSAWTWLSSTMATF